MEATERLSLNWPRTLERVEPGAVAAWLLPFLLILYLGLNDGGYTTIERSQVGIVVAWTLLVATAVGALAIGGRTLAGRLALAVFVAFAGWTALSLLGTGSAERTMLEIGRVTTYVGLFALALGLQSGERWRHMLHGAAAAAGLICAVAVLSKLEPTLFTVPPAGDLLPSIKGRLAYPLNYTSGIGAFAAISVPLLLGLTSTARTIAGQAVAAAALPVCALAMWLSASGLSVPAAGLALAAFFVLAPDRLPKLGTLLVAAAGSAILFAAVDARAALDQGLTGELARQQGDEVLTMAIVVCAGVGLLQAGIGIAVRYGHRPGWLAVPRRLTRGLAAAVAVICCVAALAFVVSGEAADAWTDFKNPSGTNFTESRGSQLLDYGSSGRYDYWRSALDAGETSPVNGIGAGTFEFWWAETGERQIFVRDAHSLYFETVAELGIVGLALIVTFTLGVVAVGVRRAIRAPAEVRTGLAAVTAGCVGFVAVAAVDWMWELAVLPVLFVILAAIAIAGGDERDAAPTEARPGWALRLAVVALAFAALAANAIVLGSAESVQASQAAARAGDLDLALERAREAVELEPYAASPRLQEALVLEQLGRLDEAARTAALATTREPDNWRTWLIRSRLEARAGNAAAAVDAYREAKALNPRSSLFTQ